LNNYILQLTAPKRQKEEIIMRSYVGEGSHASVVNYLLEVFGRNNLYFCGTFGIRFVRPKIGLPFEILEPIEYLTFTKNKEVLKPGIYRVSRHKKGDTSHFLSLQKYVDGNWIKFVSFYGGLLENFMLDWRGIRPVQEKLPD